MATMQAARASFPPEDRGVDMRLRRASRDALIAEFRTYYVDELGRAETTATSYIWALNCLEKFVGRPIHKVTPDDLRLFKRSATYAPATKQGVIVAAHAFHEWGALEGYWQMNGIMAVKTPHVNTPPKPPVATHDITILLAGCERPNEYRVVFYGLYAGCRISESARMGPANWLSDRLLFTGKGGKQRTVPIHAELQRVRHVIERAEPASVGVLQSAFARLRTRLGVRDAAGNPAPSHALRRTFGSWLYEKCDVPYEVIAALLGHGKSVTDRYAPVRFPKLLEAISVLDYSLGEPVQLTLF